MPKLSRSERQKLKRRQRNQRYYARHKERLNETRRARAVRSYSGLVNALIARRKALGWSQKELDERAGWPDGYAGKLEAFDGPQGRVAGATTLPLWFETLGIAFEPVLTVDGRLDVQRRILAEIRRPKLNGAELQRRPRREEKPTQKGTSP